MSAFSNQYYDPNHPGWLSPKVNDMTKEQETELRSMARDTYKKILIGRPHMPGPDTDEGQRKIDRLFDILAKSFRVDAV